MFSSAWKNAAGAKAIYPMNDIFLNYTFENSAYWEALRLAVNILITAYRREKPDTTIKPIEGDIQVRTQFRHLLGTDGKAARDQDIKITGEGAGSTYIEFQNRAKTDIPIEIRSVEYFGLGIGHSRGSLADQIWLWAEDAAAVLHANEFARYVLTDEITGRRHPADSGIMYISLTNLGQEASAAGELAAFLLGTGAAPSDEVVKKIADAFETSFKTFKEDKEVTGMLSLAERYRIDGILEGEARGEARGEAIGEARGKAEAALEMLKDGFPAERVAKYVKMPVEWVRGLTEQE